VSFLFVFDVFHLDFGGVEQYDACDFDGGGSAVNASFESALYEAGEPTAMVEVSVGYKDCVNARRWYRERIPVSLLEMSFLIDSTIDEYP